MRMPVAPEDVLVGIFFHLKEDNRGKITADRESLHKAFYDLKRRYPEVLKLFSFRERELFPESMQLDQALSNLDATGLISRQNLTPRYYRFEAPLVSSYQKFCRDILASAGFDDSNLKAIAQEVEHLTHENA